MSENIIHINITISGLVQGVGFRWAARNMAISFGIKGFVKNMMNGNVYIEAEGKNLQLSEFITWCYNGPAFARVENVETEKGEVKNYQHFDVVR